MIISIAVIFFCKKAPSVFVRSLTGHTDAVWSMILVDNTLVSISADSTIRVWNPFSSDESDSFSLDSVKCFNESKGKLRIFLT